MRLFKNSLILIFLFLVLGASDLNAQITYTPTLVRTINTSIWNIESPDPMGIGYLPAKNRLLMTDSEVEESPYCHWKQVNLWETDLAGNIVATYNITNFTKEPTEIAYNPTDGHYFISDDDAKKIFEINVGGDGIFATADDARTFISTNVAGLGVNDPEGVAYDTLHGYLLILDGVTNGTSSLYILNPGPNSRFDGMPSAGGDDVLVTHFSTVPSGLADPEGIEYNRDTGTIYITGRGNWILEFTGEGLLVRKIDISALKTISASGLAYAPSSLNNGAMDLYISDRGIDNANNPCENDGRIYEITLPTPTGSPTAAKLKFKVRLPDISASTTNISAANAQVELRDVAASVGMVGVDMVRNGNYFQTSSEASFNISQNKAYTLLVKTKLSLRQVFAGVNLTQSQTLDCTVVSNTACGELISQRDSKPLLSGDSDGFNTTSGSYNKIDSADLQMLAVYFNKPATGLASSADFNLDSAVNISDLEILGKNYGRVGD